MLGVGLWRYRMRKVIHLSDEYVVRRSSALRSDLLMYSPRLRKEVRAMETSFFFWRNFGFGMAVRIGVRVAELALDLMNRGLIAPHWAYVSRLLNA